jgi:hypothetical protein
VVVQFAVENLQLTICIKKYASKIHSKAL